jgi:hypothetical protein
MTSTGSSGGDPQGSLSLAQTTRKLLEDVMGDLVSGEPSVVAKATASVPPAEIQALLDDLLSKRDTYRDGALTLLAFPVAAGEPLDITARIDGDRAASGHLEQVLRDLHIPARKDALQTIAKGSSTFVGRARKSWNELLEWASEEEAIENVEAAFYYLAHKIAATARTLPPLPSLDVGMMTFPRVLGLLEELLATPSGGAYEQFVFGALLFAVAEEDGRRRVETKGLSAADASAGTAADVQVYDGGLVVEAYEVTANEWQTKVQQAIDTMTKYDLRRVHIVAPSASLKADDLITALPSGVDVSVLDIGHEARSLLHQLQRPGRRIGLVKLYEHLVERQPRDELVTQYVSALVSHGLVESE